MAETDTLRRTALHAFHDMHGGRFVDFTGWALPVQFETGIMAEHNACRSGAALFDVSHMQQVRLDHADGAPAIAAALETLVPGGITSLKPGAARYTQFTDENGGVLDDLIASHAGDHFYLVVNASRAAHDLAHMEKGLEPHGVMVSPLDRALVALQGPKAVEALKPLVAGAASLTFMQTDEAEWQGSRLRVSRLGYTGEDGFEISLDNAVATDFAEALMASGLVSLAGLGARDSLRLEAGLCLYGQDLTPETTPVEAGLAWSIPKRRRETGGFPGADIIIAQLRDGPPRKLVSILPEGRAPARAGTEITHEGQPVGTVTSGGFGPSIGAPLCLGYVEAAHAEIGTALDLMVRGKPRPARIVPTPVVAHRYVRG
jgi:aminomethyltransferase